MIHSLLSVIVIKKVQFSNGLLNQLFYLCFKNGDLLSTFVDCLLSVVTFSFFITLWLLLISTCSLPKYISLFLPCLLPTYFHSFLFSFFLSCLLLSLLAVYLSLFFPFFISSLLTTYFFSFLSFFLFCLLHFSFLLCPLPFLLFPFYSYLFPFSPHCSISFVFFQSTSFSPFLTFICLSSCLFQK